MKRVYFICAALLLVALVSPAAAADKPRIGVADFQNDTAAGWWYGGVGRELASMLSNELQGTEKFRVVERSKLEKVLDEQDLADSGRVNRKTGAKIGNLTGAEYLVFGTVSAFEHDVKETGGGLSYRGIGLGGKKDEAYIAVDLRVVNTETGEVEYSRTVEARSGGWGANMSVYRGGFGGRLGKEEKTPTGKALRAVLMEISEYLGCAMVDQDGCMDEYKQKESSRREKTKKSIKLD